MDAVQSGQLTSKQVLAKHGKSFYWASFFLGKKLADRAARLYEFCRFVDDIADGDLPHRHETLEDISQSLINHQVSAGTEVQAFLQLAKDIDIPINAATELLDGMLLDQQPTAVKDEAELLRYCHAVAGTVGLMMCRVLDCQHSRADQFAIDLGIAMQLTNIARDVLEDAKMGRRYIPANWANYTAEDIAQAQTQCRDPVAMATQRLLNLAEKYYTSALLGIQLLPFRSRFSITVALRIYRQIGIVLRRRHYAWWKGRAMVGKTEKMIISLYSLFDLRPKRVPPHPSELHVALKGLAGIDGK
ncbi:phytoene/squalene synthase family protein [Porticoccaceae bacterium]|nr:phytoene/squalene synthase family protein [Porticoccaceae bacterium]